MKKYSAFLLFFLYIFNVQAQVDYNVVKVNGGVYNNTQKQAMSTGKSLSADDQVQFTSLNNSAFIISKDNGRYIMMPDNSLQAKAGTILKPLSRRSVITTRSESNVALPQYDLFRYFGKEKYVFIDSKLNLTIDTNQIKTSDTKVFVAKYTDSKGQTHNKRIACQKGVIQFNLDEIFTDKLDNGTTALYPVELFLFDINSKELSKKAEFTPVIANSSELSGEVKVILEALKNEPSKDVLYAEIESFVYTSYGQVGEQALKQFLQDNMGLKF